MNNKIIILFTSAFPFGHGEQFIDTELGFLAKFFSEIFIFPYHYGGNMEMRNVIPENVTVYKPFRDEKHSFFKLLYKGILNTRAFFPYWIDIIQNPGIIFNRRNFSLWFRSMLNCRMILGDKRLLNCIAKYHSRLIFYFYWGHRPSGIAIGLKNLKRPIAIRFHGTDLYEEMELNHNYIPFRAIVLKSISHAIFISDHGANYIRRNFSHLHTQIAVHRLGTISHKTYPWEPSESLRIVSCSAIDENKRNWIIADAIGRLSIPIQWTHIGDGHLMNELSVLCKAIDKSNITVNLLGRLTNENVHQVYCQQQFDLFINVSQSEGVPFSIMEALSYSIPVMATAVGGTTEIIDHFCGLLLPVDLSGELLSDQLVNFYSLEFSKKIAMRTYARKRWENMCNAEKNYLEFTSFMEKL